MGKKKSEEEIRKELESERLHLRNWIKLLGIIIGILVLVITCLLSTYASADLEPSHNYKMQISQLEADKQCENKISQLKLSHINTLSDLKIDNIKQSTIVTNTSTDVCNSSELANEINKLNIEIRELKLMNKNKTNTANNNTNQPDSNNNDSNRFIVCYAILGIISSWVLADQPYRHTPRRFLGFLKYSICVINGVFTLLYLLNYFMYGLQSSDHDWFYNLYFIFKYIDLFGCLFAMGWMINKDSTAESTVSFLYGRAILILLVFLLINYAEYMLWLVVLDTILVILIVEML